VTETINGGGEASTKKIAVAALRRLLSEGVEFFGTLPNAPDPAMRTCRRRVVSNSSHQLVSELLEGPKAGNNIYLDWKGVSVVISDGRYALRQKYRDKIETFLVVELVEATSSTTV